MISVVICQGNQNSNVANEGSVNKEEIRLQNETERNEGKDILKIKMIINKQMNCRRQIIITKQNKALDPSGQVMYYQFHVFLEGYTLFRKGKSLRHKLNIWRC